MYRSFVRHDNQAPTILVVSGHPVDRAATDAARSLLGEMAVLRAVDGALGLEIAIQNLPDLVLVDPRLPDMDGEQLRTRLAADPRTCHIPALMLGERRG